MFEARLAQGSVLKKIIDATKELITEANVECSDTGLALQAMDSSHVALVSMLLRSDAFDPYRCDRALTLGMNLTNLAKILRCAGNDDSITLRAEEPADTLNLTFEGSNEKVSEYKMKLMDIDAEHLEIPDSEYEAMISMSSTEFLRICRDLLVLSEEVVIEAVKGTVSFTAKGELGSGAIALRHNTNVDKEDDATIVDLQQPVRLTFSLKYLANFAKTSALAGRVVLAMGDDLPMMVEFKIEDVGYIKYYLAPKIDDD